MSQTNSGAGMPPWMNHAIKLVLRSPLHGMISKYLTLITFKGSQSGKVYTTPVSYSLHGDQAYIFTHANWWKNLRGGAPVTLRLRGKNIAGIAESVAEDKKAIAEGLTAHLRKAPFDARFYDVTMDEDGNPNAKDVEQAAKTTVMIRVQFT